MPSSTRWNGGLWRAVAGPARAGLVTGVMSVMGLVALPACNIVGPLAYFAHGPEKIEKAHELDGARPTIVLVENGRGMELSERTLRTIADTATEALLKERVLKSAIDPQAAYIAAANDPAGKRSPIVEIGRKAGAEVVVYVTVDAFALTPDGYTFQPTAVMSARVFDATAVNEDGSLGRRVWPAEGEPAHEFTASSVQRQGTAPRDQAGMRQAESELAQRAGQTVAWLFYDVVPETAADARTPR